KQLSTIIENVLIQIPTVGILPLTSSSELPSGMAVEKMMLIAKFRHIVKTCNFMRRHFNFPGNEMRAMPRPEVVASSIVTTYTDFENQMNRQFFLPHTFFFFNTQLQYQKKSSFPSSAVFTTAIWCTFEELCNQTWFVWNLEKITQVEFVNRSQWEYLLIFAHFLLVEIQKATMVTA
ncbi:hypothetical protein L9F63_018001, partial [Diploptera punctata]